MTIMLSIVGALKEEGGDSRTVAFDGEVENPWLEAKTKHVPELAALKTENKLAFGSITFQSTVNSKGFSISSIPTTLMAVPMLFAYTYVPLSIYHLTVYGAFYFASSMEGKFSFHLSLAASDPFHSIIKYGGSAIFINCETSENWAFSRPASAS